VGFLAGLLAESDDYRYVVFVLALFRLRHQHHLEFALSLLGEWFEVELESERLPILPGARSRSLSPAFVAGYSLMIDISIRFPVRTLQTTAFSRLIGLVIQ
jgi:hypothetical protein